MTDLAQLVARRPTNATQLHRFVTETFGYEIPRRRVCPHHAAPLEYLAASFFSQEDLLIWASRGGGKTLVAAVATLLDAIFHAPTDIVVLGGSFDQSDRLGEYVRRMLDGRDDWLDGRMTRERIRFANGSRIRIVPQSQRAIRGLHVQKIRCDEADLFDPDVWRAVQFTTRSAGESRGSIEVLSTLHRSGGLMDQLVSEARREPPPRRRGRPRSRSPRALAGYRLLNWCLWEVIERCPAWRRCEGCPLEGDCGGLARKGTGYFRIDDAIAIQARSSRAAWEAEMLCRGAGRDWLVLPEFDPARHVAKMEYCAAWPLYRAIDFGYRNPLVCLWVQLTPDGHVHVLDEYAHAQLPLARHADAILRHDLRLVGGCDDAQAADLMAAGRRVRVRGTCVDPAGAARESTSGAACTEILAAAGIPCTSRASTIREGLELIRAALAPAEGPPTFRVHPRCRRLIDALRTYHYAPHGQGNDDSPVKDGPDHFVDALRYFFVNCCRPRIAVRRIKY
ncbi:MAG TPA: hypothetical protein PK082_07780 [Phycisphaerae bacterium]|nr:hypothetical protein [Phycisphaerae bacterium]